MPIRFRRTLFLAIGMLLLVSSPAFATAAAKHPNFTGVWVMDTTKFENKDPRLTGLLFRVTQKADTLQVITETSDGGHESSFGATYRLDGKPRQNAMPDGSGMATATLAWDDATLVLGTRFDIQGRDYKMTQRWTLDAAHKTLTEERLAESGDRRMAQHFVFTKRVATAKH